MPTKNLILLARALAAGLLFAVFPALATPISAARNSKAATFRSVVTAFSGWKNPFFLQDETGAILVDRLEQTLV